MSITASMLYNLVQCPHRVTLDIFGDAAQRDPVTPFTQLLWDKGHLFEQDVIRNLGTPYTDLKSFSGDEREARTREAMDRGDPLIYGGRIVAEELVGEPDLLRRETIGYVAGDIKSGAGEEGATEETDGKPKKHYAVQLALYTDILERQGRSAARRPFVWDVHGQEVVYDLDTPQGVRDPVTLWASYESCLAEAQAIASQRKATLPALSGICKSCHWRTMCTTRVEDLDDLTLIPDIGRSKRDALASEIPTVQALAQVDLSSLIRGKKSVVPGIGPDSLVKFQERARLQVQPGGQAYLRESFTLPTAEVELFFDIETDPFRDICYLHGFAERRGGSNGTERFIPFLADQPKADDERRAFAAAWEYIKSSQPCAIYFYSAYERTWWRKLRKRYPEVATESEIEALFTAPRTLDLMTVARSMVVWPTRNHSIKSLATHLGFKWRDVEPSGAASIEWYNRWVTTNAEDVRQRILDYNEDDCRAMRVLRDFLQALSTTTPGRSRG